MSDKKMNIVDKTHELVQLFLTKFKKNSSNDKFSFYFKSNPNVYTVEPQIPDLYIKTRKPFDKNECFVIEKDNEVNEALTKGGHNKNFKNTLNNIKPNLFPR
jgi:hypothetical protein